VTGAVVLIVVLALAGWRISLWLHPYRTCGACNGAGETFGRVFTRSRGACRGCGGTGQVPRIRRRRGPLG